MKEYENGNNGIDSEVDADLKEIKNESTEDNNQLRLQRPKKNIDIKRLLKKTAFLIAGIVIGGDMVVNSATSIAKSFGMSANLVGLTIVAVGTSLPEFVTSIVAIKKGETEIAIGNVIGSNLFNILLVLGLAAVINPISMSMLAFIDIIFMVLITLLLYMFMKKKASR